MARDRRWVMVSTKLLRHRKLAAVARKLSIPRYAAQGLMVGFYQLAREDEKWGAMEPEDIAYLLGWEGDPDELVQAYVETGLLEVVGDGYAIHDWGEYTGVLVEEERKEPGRKKERERKRDYRARVKKQEDGTTRDSPKKTRDSHANDRYSNLPSDSPLKTLERESESGVTSRVTEEPDEAQDRPAARDPSKCYRCQDAVPTLARKMYGMGEVRMCQACAAWVDDTMERGKRLAGAARRDCPDCAPVTPCAAHMPPDAE